MPLGVEVGLGPGDFVLDEDPALPQKAGTAPQFSARVHCDQTAGCIRIPLGTEVGLGPSGTVLDGDPALFGPCLLWPNGLMYQDTTWYGGRPRPRRHCVIWGPAPPPKMQPPIFGACLLWLNGRPSQLL